MISHSNQLLTESETRTEIDLCFPAYLLYFSHRACVFWNIW